MPGVGPAEGLARVRWRAETAMGSTNSLRRLVRAGIGGEKSTTSLRKAFLRTYGERGTPAGEACTPACSATCGACGHVNHLLCRAACMCDRHAILLIHMLPNVSQAASRADVAQLLGLQEMLHLTGSH